MRLVQALNARYGVAVQAQRGQAGGVRVKLRQLAHGCDPRANTRQARAIGLRGTSMLFVTATLLLAPTTHHVIYTYEACVLTQPRTSEPMQRSDAAHFVAQQGCSMLGSTWRAALVPTYMGFGTRMLT
jgi:hypothetical protein